MRILHVIPSISPKRGGPSQAVVEMVKSLREQNIEAQIVTSNDDGEGLLVVQTHELIDYQGVPVRFFPRWSPPIRALREFAFAHGFSDWLSKHIHEFDLVHIHALFSYCSTQAMRIARANNIPYVLRPLGLLQPWSLNQSAWRKKLFLTLWERTNINRAAYIHCTSDLEAQQVKHGFKNAKVKTIALGIEMPNIELENIELERPDSKQLGIPAQQPLLLYLSRLHPKKGLEQTLEALSLLQNKHWHFAIAGDGDPAYIEKLKAKVDSLELTQRCSFLGHIGGQSKAHLFQAAHLFVLCSHAENFGISVLEAMAHGTAPLVSYEVALAQIIKENKLGYACELNTDAIADALNEALDNTDETKKRAELARLYVADHFQWPAIAIQLNEIYRSSLRQ